jgi:hypothetical protein
MLRQSGKQIMVGAAALLVLSATWLTEVSRAATILSTPAPVLLSTLVNNPSASYTVGDKKFTGFSYLATGDMPPATGVNVAAILDDAGNYGIRFQGAFVDLPSSPGGSDALINYIVETTDPLKLISDAHLAGNPTLLGTQGSISVVETFLPLGQNGEYTMRIFDDESVGQKLTDQTIFATPVKRLSVQKDILVIATPQSQTVTMSFVDQSFSQVTIPEATTITLALIGLVSTAGMVRRKH